MIKEVVLKFEVTDDSFKDGNLLLYDKKGRYFYSTSPEQFLHRQEAKIRCLKKENEELKKNFESLKSSYEKEKEEFLKQYQSTNKTIIEMIESFIKNYGGKD